MGDPWHAIILAADTGAAANTFAGKYWSLDIPDLSALNLLTVDEVMVAACS